MAIIYSYPTLAPQLGDKVLGSNIVDSAGQPVLGNPTVQYTLNDIKLLVDQNFVQQLYSSSALTITPPQDNTGASIKFGASNIGTNINNVYYVAATNTFTFKPGTYYIQLAYNTRGNGGTSPKFVFITKDGDGNQIGPTTLNKITRGVTADRQLVNIDIMINISSVTSYNFWAAQEDIASGALVVDAFATGWTDVPSAGITISKLI
jgi:hypothetical protein|tara:strand:- start:112 stop:729 length:618 start_codon:yes stop_codon:yes gene_type:complete